MKRFLPYILIVFTLVNFLAPVSIGLSEKNRVVVEKNVANADADKYKTAFPNSSISQDASNYIDETTAGVDLSIKIDTGVASGTSSTNNWGHVQPKLSLNTASSFLDEEEFIVVFTEKTTNKTGWIDFTKQLTIVDGVNYGDKLSSPDMYNSATIKPYIKSMTPIGDNGVSQFKPDTEYEANFYYLSCNTRIGCIDGGNDRGGDKIVGFDESGNYFKIATGNIKTANKIQTVTGGVNQTGSTVTPGQNADTMPACSMTGAISLGLLSGNGTFVGCVAQTIYYILFVPTSYLFALAGNFFDWTFAYSVNDASYRSGFVVQGWGVVRDFCNMFFIFVLLYVAFTTILGTQDAKTKEMIVHVVLIGLLINFSLFATQVIIDASNILARVFYNSNTIVITPNGSTVGQTGLNTTPSDTGIIPLSEALVNKINPQNLIINAKSVTDFSTQSNIGVAKNASNDDSISVGRFIIVTLLATGINVMGFLVFLSVALIFVSRVVGLWIAMILSPMVFFTYMVPKLKSMEMIGWTKWWPETISLAFLAPVFVFFLYIILKFLQTDLVFMTHTANETGIQMVIATIVPFAFIMILLNKSKEIAKKMSGTMGQMITDGISKAGGLALGVATGGAAFAMRGTIGKYASGVANDEALKEKAKEKGFGGAIARAKLKTAAYTSKASFDARNTQAGQQFSKQTGINMDNGSWVGMGKDKGKGGFRGIQEKKQKRDAENSENMKQSISAGADQDARAKTWNDDYMDHLLAARTSHEKSNPDIVFDEANFKKNYEKGNAQYTNANGAQVTVGEKRVLNSDDTNRSRFTDRANEIEYGPDYIKNRETAKQAQGDLFNENDFKKTLTKSNLSERESALVKELRKKGTPEKTPLNVVEKENITKIVDKAKKAFEHANKELDLVNTGLEEISAEVHGRDGAGNLNVAIEDLTKKDTATYIDQKGFNDDISILETDISVLTARINKDPNAANIQTLKNELIIKNKEKKKVEREINKVTSLLSDQRIHQNTKKDSARTVNDNNEVLSRGYK